MDHARSVRADQRIHDALAVRARLDQHGAGAVAEHHAGGAVGIVDDGRHLVGTDHHDLLGLAGGDELRGDGDGVDEARTGRLHVEGADRAGADHVADQIGGGGKYEIGRGGGADQKVDVGGLVAGALQQPADRFGAHMRGAEPLALQDAPLLDAGALDDPGIGRVDQPGELGIVQHVVRKISANPCNCCSFQVVTVRSRGCFNSRADIVRTACTFRYQLGR